MSVGNILITGSNRGIGLELVKQLSRSGPPPKNILATCRDPEKAKALQDVKEAAKNIVPIHLVALDVANKESIAKAADQVSSIVGEDGLNVLINNAGILMTQGTPTSTSEEEMLTTFRVNAVGSLLCIQAFLDQVKKAASQQTGSKMSFGRAAIVNMSSILASMEISPQVGALYTAYSISKAGVNMLTLKTAAEVKDSGILVVALHPGYVKTDMTNHEGYIEVEESVTGILRTLQMLDESKSGSFIDYTGSHVKW